MNRFTPLGRYPDYSEEEQARRAAAFFAQMNARRTVRDFSSRPIAQKVIEDCLRAASTAPSGANMQPWHFVVVSDAAKKREIRMAAEAEEREFYEHRASEEWLEALAPLGTDANKPCLETAPYLIVVFAQTMHYEQGRKVKHYYPLESTGLATGLLLTALHNVGLATLTHTPSPLKFLNQILDRPKHEKPFVIVVTGYAAEDAKVPDITRKPLDAISTFIGEE